MSIGSLPVAPSKAWRIGQDIFQNMNHMQHCAKMCCEQSSVLHSSRAVVPQIGCQQDFIDFKHVLAPAMKKLR